MQTINSRSTPQPLRTQWIIWGALLATHFLYAFVAYSTSLGGPREDWQQLFLLKPLIIMSGIMLVLSHVLPKRVFTASVASLPTGASREAILMRTSVPNIISWALNESIAVYGLILAFRTADVTPYYIFAGVGILNMLILRPNPEKWLARAKEIAKSLGRRHE